MSSRTKTPRRDVGVLILIAAVAFALIAGVAIGYVARGEPDPGDPVTIEGEVPAVTVTVPAAP
jgi:hypothetical protein